MAKPAKNFGEKLEKVQSVAFQRRSPINGGKTEPATLPKEDVCSALGRRSSGNATIVRRRELELLLVRAGRRAVHRRFGLASQDAVVEVELVQEVVGQRCVRRGFHQFVCLRQRCARLIGTAQLVQAERFQRGGPAAF